MANQYVLDLNVNKATNTGAFIEYANAGGAPVVNVNPSGRVWWLSTDGATWNPLPATKPVPANQNKDGDPNYANPTLHNGDVIGFQLVDLNPTDPNNKVSSVQFVAVFAKKRNPQDQNQHLANRASPFQTDATQSGRAKTIFISPLLTAPTSGNLFTWPQFSQPPCPLTATYPRATTNPAKAPGFTFYVAATVTFGDGTVVQYAHDPEMDVPDYGG